MEKTKFIGLENLKKQKSERSFYVEFGMVKEGKSYRFYTNRNLEGLFFYDEHSKNYVQKKGTQQFSMDCAESTARKRIKNVFED